MSPSQALALLANFEQMTPADRQAAVNTIATFAPVWAQQALSRDQKIVGLIKQLNTGFEALRVAVNTLNGGGAAPSAQDDGTASAPAAGETGRFNADGSPMSAADAALEAAMDGAVDGSPMASQPSAPAPDPLASAPVPIPQAKPARNGSAASKQA